MTFGGKAFRVVPLDAAMWSKLIAVTSLVLIVGEIVRFAQSSSAPKTEAVAVRQ